jgi:hypothetical protein
MTMTINVLAVLDRADDALLSTGREDLHALANELGAVRDAVFELIDAVSDQINDPSSSNIIRNKRRVMAALSLVGGA